MDHPEAVVVSWDPAACNKLDKPKTSRSLYSAGSALVVCVDALPHRNNALRSVQHQFPFTRHVEENVNSQRQSTTEQ